MKPKIIIHFLAFCFAFTGLDASNFQQCEQASTMFVQNTQLAGIYSKKENINNASKYADEAVQNVEYILDNCELYIDKKTKDDIGRQKFYSFIFLQMYSYKNFKLISNDTYLNITTKIMKREKNLKFDDLLAQIKKMHDNKE
jgi:hypothetical protein